MPITYHEHVLDNGMRIVAETDPDAHSAAAGFFVATGARDEASPLMGVSHYLEHMMFKGTERLSADDINRSFDEMGARNNAYTSHELTCFYAQVLPEQLGRALDTLGQMMRPALRQDDFDTEKQVILEEIAMYKDNPFWVLYEACLEAHYQGTGMAHRVLGTNETVSALERDQMMAYFENRYSADNTIVSLAGRVDFDQAVKDVERLCGDWQRTSPQGRGAIGAPETNEVRLTDERVNRAYMIGIAQAPSATDERRYAATLLAQVLGSHDNSRLHWALIEPGLAEEAQAAFDPHDGVGDYFVYASGDPERADEIWSVVEREMEGVADSVTPDDLERLRTKLATGVTLAGEKPHDRMQRLGRLWTTLGQYITLEEELERINAVTLDDVKQVARDFPLRAQTTGRLTPA